MQVRETSRLYAMGVLCIASSLCFFLTAVVKLPVVLYFPLSHRWSLTPVPGELSMDYYGRSLLSLLCGAGAAALTLAAFRVYALFCGAAPQSQTQNRPDSDTDRPDAGANPDSAKDAPPAQALRSGGDADLTPARERGDADLTPPPESSRGLTLLASYTATALLLAAGVYAYELYGRTPVPEPLPAGFSALPPGFPPRSGN